MQLKMKKTALTYIRYVNVPNSMSELNMKPAKSLLESIYFEDRLKAD